MEPFAAVWKETHVADEGLTALLSFAVQLQVQREQAARICSLLGSFLSGELVPNGLGVITVLPLAVCIREADGKIDERFTELPST